MFMALFTMSCQTGYGTCLIRYMPLRTPVGDGVSGINSGPVYEDSSAGSIGKHIDHFHWMLL
jgi:hypothetical protein